MFVCLKYYESFLPEGGGWKDGNPGYPGIPGKLPKGLVGLGAAPPPLLSMAWKWKYMLVCICVL